VVKWISVKIVVDGKDESRCDSACPHYSQKAGADNAEEQCGLYRCRLIGKQRCDWCREAKEL
jgi:hypothetical protein